MSFNKYALLLTENKEGEFSQKVIQACSHAGQKLIVEPATFDIFGKVIDGKIGVIIVDREEYGKTADHFHKAVRVFHSYTPVLMATLNKILLEQMMTYTFDREVSVDRLSEIIVKAFEFDDELEQANREFNLRLANVSHLTGDDLKKAIDQIRKEVFSDPKFKMPERGHPHEKRQEVQSALGLHPH